VPFRCALQLGPYLLTVLFVAGVPPLRGADANLPSGTQFDDPLLPLEPRRAATEAEQDQATALTHYGLGREAEARGDRAAALRHFQRSLRYAPDSQPAAKAALRLALELQRPAQAIHPARHIEPVTERDRRPFYYLALYLAREGQWQESIDLYRRIPDLEPGAAWTEDDVRIMLEIGRLCRMVEDFDRGSDYFAQVLAILDNPRDHKLSTKARKAVLGEAAKTYQMMGMTFLAAQRPDEAKAAFDRAAEADSAPARTALNATRLHRQAGRLPEAYAELGTYFASAQTDEGLEAYSLLEELLDEMGRAEDLLGYLEDLQQKGRDSSAFLYFLAQKYDDAERTDQAEKLYTELVNDAPTSTAYRRLVEIHLDRQEYDRVRGIVVSLVDKTGSLDALGEAADRLVAAEEAVDELLAAARESPTGDDPPAAALLEAAILTALAAERFDAIAPLMDGAVAAGVERTDSLLLSWGLDLLTADRNAESAEVLRRGADREGVSDNQRAIFLYYLAAALEMNGETDAALEAARQAGKHDEDSALLQARVAWVLYHADRFDEAAAAYRATIDQFDADYESEQSRRSVRQARMVLSNLCLPKQRIDEAIEWLEQVLDEFPEYPGALNDLGYLWADENMHLERAQRMITQAVAAEPENAAYRDSLGWVLYRRGHLDEALVELEKAVALEADPVVLDHLGEVYQQAGKPTEATEAWQRSLEQFEADGQDDEAAKIRVKLNETNGERSD